MNKEYNFKILDEQEKFIVQGVRINNDGSEEMKIWEVKGNPVIIHLFPDVDFFVHFEEWKMEYMMPGFSLSEKTSGFCVANGHTESEAICEGIEIMRNLKQDELKEYIKARVTEKTGNFKPLNQ